VRAVGERTRVIGGRAEAVDGIADAALQIRRPLKRALPIYYLIWSWVGALRAYPGLTSLALSAQRHCSRCALSAGGDARAPAGNSLSIRMGSAILMA
jgi:hypothetical protein